MRRILGTGLWLSLGGLLGVFLAPTDWVQEGRASLQATSQTLVQRASLWAASQSDRVGARESLFIESPGIIEAIQRGGAFGGDFSRAIATDIFARSEAGMADADRLGRITAVAERTWLIQLPLVNVVVFETDAGLVVVDTGMTAAGPTIKRLITSVTSAPIHTIVYTHGHVYHAYGTWALLADEPQILASEALPRRFDRYIALRGSLAKYMGQPVESLPRSPEDLVYPTRTFGGELSVSVGGETFELRARPGETDDQLYVWAPERKIIAAADYYQGFLPNAGNGKRVQRYPEEWAAALREMAGEKPQLLLPAHGDPLRGVDTISDSLLTLAEALEWVINHTYAELNKGTRQDLIPASLTVPPELRDHPTLNEQYVSWRDIAKMVMRRHVGWWDDIPSHWTPATFDAQAAEIIALAGGVEALADRARSLLDTDIIMASHLADWAWFGEPGNPAAQQLIIDVYAHRIINTPSNTQEILAYLESMTQARRLQLTAQNDDDAT